MLSKPYFILQVFARQKEEKKKGHSLKVNGFR
jgi:hypothetical protein